LIYAVVLNYLVAVDQTFWSRAKPDSFITKTVGVQALLDILKKICAEAVKGKDVSAPYFQSRLAAGAVTDFADSAFKKASGSGRTLIRRYLELQIGLLQRGDLDPEDEVLKLNDALARAQA
jgi:hypothetical protein